jgi:hypothetical protein
MTSPEQKADNEWQQSAVLPGGVLPLHEEFGENRSTEMTIPGRVGLNGYQEQPTGNQQRQNEP